MSKQEIEEELYKKYYPMVINRIYEAIQEEIKLIEKDYGIIIIIHDNKDGLFEDIGIYIPLRKDDC